MSDPKKVIAKQQEFFREGMSKELPFRLEQLAKLKRVLKEHEEELIDAIYRDFKKPPFESYATEVGLLYSEIDHIRRNLKKWARPKKVRGSILNFPSRNRIHQHPYGVSLVIGAWNYPLQLSLAPVLGSIAAGNCTVIKPSEISQNASRVLAEIINSNFDEGYLKVVEGGADTTQALLDQPLDYIFFTGSTRVGKIIMEAAAKQLTPVTLELGGKSPAIIDETADIQTAARRTAWGKFLNAGQTCVAPDYLYVHRNISKEFTEQLIAEIEQFFNSDPKQSPDFARIINDGHFERLSQFLNNGTLVYGGETDSESLYIEPTVLKDISWEDPVMQEEIFGPILPVLEFDDINLVINEIRKRPSPLALYLFSNSRKMQKKIIHEIPFGGGCINDVVAHLGNHNLPFGGVGQSGLGSYHGKSSFDVFSHQKSIMKKTTWFDNPLRYPPYKGKLKWLKKIIN